MLKKRKPAIFLDRDGVLTKEKSYICSVGELEIFPYTADCIQQIKDKGYYAIVITNQSGIARGLFSEDELRKMNQYLLRETGVDAIYYCPHHPEGIVEKYKKVCRCRKPEIGLIEQACKDFNIDMDKSYIIGDRSSDIIAGQRAGIKTVLLESGYGTKNLEKYVSSDYVFDNLYLFLGLL